jgi:hypothetical protein
MTVLRVIFFRLYESPRFLVAAGRPKEAMENLQMISRFNGEELSLSLRDVRDHITTVTHRRPTSATAMINDDEEDSAPFLRDPEDAPKPIFDADAIPETETTRISSTPQDSSHYHSTGESNINLESHSFATPVVEHSHSPFFNSLRNENDEDGHKLSTARRIQPRRHRSSVYSVSTVLPSTVRKPLWKWFDKVAMLLSPEWLWTTLMMWAAWFSMSLGDFFCCGSIGWKLTPALSKRTRCSTSTCPSCSRRG